MSLLSVSAPGSGHYVVGGGVTSSPSSLCPSVYHCNICIVQWTRVTVCSTALHCHFILYLKHITNTILIIFYFQVAVEDDFTNSGPGSGNSSTTASSAAHAHTQSHPNNFEMNPQQSSTSYAPGFYGQPGAGFTGGTGYQGPMSPYGAGPMSPYSNQGAAPPPNGAVSAGPGSMYSNQNNSPIYNQNQSSSYPPSGGAGNYSHQTGAPGFPSSMQSYYNNHSPTDQYQYGPGGPPPVRLSPPPMGMMLGSSRIPHPNMNSPNQNVVTGNNQMKTENMDLKTGGGMYSHGAAPVSQGYSQSSYGYNGYSAMSGPGRPLVSPMSPHGRLNISPGGPNLSPREGPPNMSPHPSMYSQQQPSPGPGPGSSYPGSIPPGHHGSFQAQYSEYFSKQSQPGAQHSPLSSGSGGYSGGAGGQGPGTKEGGQSDGDKLSDAQSNAGSVRSGDQETGDTPAHSSFGDDSNHTLTNLVPSSIKKETSDGAVGDNKPSDIDIDKLSSSADSDMENKFEIKSEKLKTEPDEIKTEGSSYYDQHKDFTLKANQTLIDNMDINSIPELPEIPELKYDDMSEMTRLQQNSQDGDKEGGPHKNTPPGLSPECKDGMVRDPWNEGGEEDGYHDMGWGHMQGRTF